MNSIPKEDGLAVMRALAFPHLQGQDFDTILEEARAIHRLHPDDTLVPKGEMPSGPIVRSRMEENIRLTREEMMRQHCEEVMMPFLRKDVPYSVAGKIVNELVMKE